MSYGKDEELTQALQKSFIFFIMTTRLIRESTDGDLLSQTYKDELADMIDCRRARLMKRYVIGSFLFAAYVICAACSSSAPGLDKTKFNGVTSAAQAVRGTLESGAGFQAFNGALQKLSEEITALKNRATNDPEKELTKDYSDLYSTYHDGYILWKYKIEFTRYGFVPRELIYVGQDIEPIIEKYKIPVQLHVYAPTHQSWKSIPASSLEMIWGNADSQLQIINNILTYR